MISSELVSMFCAPRSLWRRLRGHRPARKRPRRAGPCRQPMETLETRTMLSGYSGPIYQGVDYNPTWPGWSSTAAQQFSDSDFFDNAFQGLWGTVSSSKAKHLAKARRTKAHGKSRAGTSAAEGRNDLGTIHNIGFNEIRLYNWSPTRGWDGTEGTGHDNFLNYANSLGVNVMVPVSNYFLSNDQYSWNGQRPDASFSWDSAPLAIQQDLVNFVSSITVNGKISPAVQSIEIGNEIDLSDLSQNGPPTDATVRLERAMWWVVNLQAYISKEFPGDPHPLLTIPVSNADQGFNGSDLSWFEVFVKGVQAGQQTPNGTNDGATFTQDVNGLDSYSWYTSWYFNSYQTYQYGQGLTNLLQQYNEGGIPGSKDWSTAWPGQAFDVPLMLTEVGLDRLTAGSEAQQANYVANLQAQVIQTVITTAGSNNNIMGYDIFEFNDEPNKNNDTSPAPYPDAVYGLYKYYSSNDVNDFRNGNVSYTLQTGDTPVGYTTFPSVPYPVYQLYGVNSSSGESLPDELKAILAKPILRKP
jgi:hypothetical protein